MTVRSLYAWAIALCVAAPALAGDPGPPAVADREIATYVPVGPQQSTIPLPSTYAAPGMLATNAFQTLFGVTDWTNTNVWPAETATGLNLGRYIELTLSPLPGRVVRVTRFSYASRSYGNSTTALTLFSSADNFAAPLGAATSVGSGGREVDLSIPPSVPVEFDLPRTFRLHPFQLTTGIEWLDLVGANGGLRIEGRIALVRAPGVGQDRYSFSADQLGGVELPPAITHVQFAVAPPGVVLLPFAATAPRTACVPATALLDIGGPVNAAFVNGTAAPCGVIDPTASTATTLWKLADGRIYGLQVISVLPQLAFRVRRLDDGVFGDSFE